MGIIRNFKAGHICKKYCIFMILAGFLALAAGASAGGSGEVWQKDFLLPMESSCIDAQAGDIRLMFWTSSSKGYKWVKEYLAELGMTWQEQELRNSKGETAWQWTTTQTVTREQETVIRDLCRMMEKATRQHPVSFYFEERLEGFLDMDSYLRANRLPLLEYWEDKELVSYMAPQTQVLIRAGENGRKKIILARPALLEDF